MTTTADAWRSRAERVEDYPVRGADPRLTIRRVFDRYAYPANGNVGRPTPYYRWLLLADGQLVDQAGTKRALVAAARDNGAAYLASPANNRD